MTGFTRRDHGRGHSYWLDGEKLPGVTTILGSGFPKPALVNWAADVTAGYAVDNWERLAELGPSVRLKEISRARWDVQKAAALRGTRVHEYAQLLQQGQTIDVPEEYVGHVDSYLKFVEDWQPRELLVEQPVFSRVRRYAGTLDLVAVLADRRTWLLDIKTSEKGVFLDNVLQLAALRYAEWTVVDEAEVPMPQIDATGIINVRADGYDLIPVEADENAFRLFLYCREIGKYVEGDRELWVGDPVLPPSPVEAA